MNITSYDKTKYGIEGTGIDTTTTKERVWKDKQTGEVTVTIPAGAKVHVDFSPQKYPGSIFITYGENVQVSKTSHGCFWLKGIRKYPKFNTLQKWSFDGVAKSVTGKTVEPDGYSYDGSPSWLLVFSLI